MSQSLGVTLLGFRSYPTGLSIPEAITITFSFFRSLESSSNLSKQSSQLLHTPLPMFEAPRWGILRFWVLDPFRLQGPHQHFGAQAVILALHHWVSMATNLGHSHSGQTISGLSKRDSGPPILAEPAHNNRVESPPRKSEPDLRDLGTLSMDMFDTVHNTHLPQFMSPILEPRALGIDALSQDWQGRSMFMFPLFPCLAKSFRNSGPPRRAK